MRSSRRFLRTCLLALTSAVLLVIAFPNFNQVWAAWVALVPWLVLLRTASARAAFWWSYAIGAAFFLASIWWLIHVTVVGWLILCAYLAVFFGAFGWLARAGGLAATSVWQLGWVPALWVALEWLRSHLFSGFGWNLLAYSQTPWLAPLQLAELTGVWGVSFLIVLVNTAVAAAIAAAIAAAGPRPSRGSLLAIAAAALGMAVLYGTLRIPRVLRGVTVRMAVVQGNIPQEQKWDEAHADEIVERYETLTRMAARTDPDLIVWPETSVPGYFGFEAGLSRRIVNLAVEVGRPLLVGSPRPGGAREALTNSASFVGADGSVGERYDKLHLVPFGEFIPLERFAPWLRAALPPIGEFVPGQAYTVFHGGTGPGPAALPPFAVLICFEDVFPALARGFVVEGARILLNITNDAWFGPTAAAYQHAQAATFRAVELRVPVVRAANTGWSGCIDPAGRWVGSVQDPRSGRELFVAGTRTCEVPLGSARSPYQRWGDWFAWLSLILSIGWLGTQLLVREGVS